MDKKISKNERYDQKTENTQKHHIISNMQTEAVKSQIEKIAQKHYINLNNLFGSI